VTPWEAHTGEGSWKDLWTRGESSPRWSRFVGRACDPMGEPCWSSLFLKDCTLWEGPVERTCAGAVFEELQPMGRTHVGEVHGGLSPVKGPHTGAGKNVRREEQ